MPLPVPLTTLTVRGTLLAVDGTPLVGTVSLIPLVDAQSPAGDVLIGTTPLTRTIGTDGTVEWTGVLATDSPGLSNPVPYRLKISTAGYRDDQVLELLTTQAVNSVLRLDDIAPTSTPPPVISYLLAAALGQTGGPAGPLDNTGRLPSAQVPAVGGITVHAMLTGLTADDHPHYLTQDRGNALYYTRTQTDTQHTGLVPTSRQITAGTGLAGGGTLATDRTLNVVYGTTTATAAAGDDTRLSDPRTPTAHAASHANGGSDPLTPAAIGAATTSHTHTITDVTGLQDALDALPRLAATTQTGTTYTLALADAGTAVELTAATPVTVTVPPASAVAFATGTVIELLQYGAGQITLAPGAGVALRAPSGSLTSRTQNATLSLRKRGTDEWIVSGDLT